MNGLHRWKRISWIVGAAGLIICLISLFFARARVFQAYWMAWIFWSGLSFGAMILLMMHALTGGAWGDAVRPAARAAAQTLPLALVLFLPALFGLGDLFSWTHAATFAGHDWPHKRAYLATPWFIVRGIGYFVIFGLIGVRLGYWRRSAAFLPASGPISALGIVVYTALMLFASTDWVVSLEPAWYTTMFVVIFGIDHMLMALALTTAAVTWQGTPVRVKALHDLGNLLLALVIFWAYISFSQFLITWSGNLPREISWYLHRSAGAWPAVAIALALFQFAAPFALLLLRIMKKQKSLLRPIALLVLAAGALNVWWLVTPSFQPEGVRWPILEIIALLGIGGVWVALFLTYWEREPIALPVEPEGEVTRA